MGRFLPPDHDAGDANTIGGYLAVHARPAAFEGKDGASYSVEIVVDESDDRAAPYVGYLLFVRWGGDGSNALGHVETDYLVTGPDETAVRARLGAFELREAKRLLDAAIDRANPPDRPWYEAMRDA